jgi:hypothetical protein
MYSSEPSSLLRKACTPNSPMTREPALKRVPRLSAEAIARGEQIVEAKGGHEGHPGRLT